MRLLSIVLLLCCFTISSYAQGEHRNSDRKKMKGKMEAQKIAFITQELDLSTEEAQQFWPVYNEYTKELEAIKKDRPNRREMQDKVLTDSEAASQLSTMIETEKRHTAIKEDYIGQMKNVLSIQKVAKLFRLEHRFKREMLNKLGKSRANRRMKSEKGAK